MKKLREFRTKCADLNWSKILKICPVWVLFPVCCLSAVFLLWFRRFIDPAKEFLNDVDRDATLLLTGHSALICGLGAALFYIFLINTWVFWDVARELKKRALGNND